MLKNWLMWLRNKISVNVFMVLALLVVLPPLYLGAEKINNTGQAADGIFYAQLAKDFYSKFHADDVSAYRMQRILPSAIIYHTLQIANVPRTDGAVLVGFIFINVIAAASMAYFWGKIADLLNISSFGKYLGFIGLFINFAVLKMASFYPILTDMSGYALGLIAVYYYLTSNTRALYVIMLIGAFTWPTMGYMAILLLMFPYKTLLSMPESRFTGLFSSIITAYVPLFVLGWILILWNYTEITPFFISPTDLQTFIWLSVPVVLLYLFLGLRVLVNFPPAFAYKNYLSEKNLKGVGNLLLPILVFIAIRYFQNWIGNNTSQDIDTLSAISNIFSTGSYMPAIFLSAHFIYFGPLIAIAVINWKSISKTIHQYGLGIYFVAILGFCLSIYSESRTLVNFYSFFMPFIIKAVDGFEWQKPFFWVFFSISLVVSRIWLSINHLGENWLSLYFMNHGPWMTIENYFVSISITLIFIYLFWAHQPKKSIKIHDFIVCTQGVTE